MFAYFWDQPVDAPSYPTDPLQSPDLVPEEDHGADDIHNASCAVGMALTCGFIFMLLVDQIGGAHGGHSHGTSGS